MRRKKKYECTTVEITKCWNVPVHTFIRKNSSISESSIRDKHKKMIGGYKKFCHPSSPPPHSSLLYYPSEFRNRKGTGHTRKNTENTRWKHHHRNFNGSAQYIDTATTLLPCNRAPATNGQSTNMTSQAGDLWHPPVNLPRATKHAPMSQVASKNEHTAPSSPPLSPEVTPWQAK